MKIFGRTVALPSLTDSNIATKPDEPMGASALSLVNDNNAEPPKGPAAQELPPVTLEKQLARLRKRASFVVAEATLVAKRESRASAMAAFREVLSEHQRLNGAKATEVAAADAEVNRIDVEITAARRVLHAEREAMRPRFHSLVAEYRRAAAERIVAACNAIETAQEVEQVAARFAMTAGIGFKPTLLVRDIAFLKAEATALAGRL